MRLFNCPRRAACSDTCASSCVLNDIITVTRNGSCMKCWEGRILVTSAVAASMHRTRVSFGAWGVKWRWEAKRRLIGSRGSFLNRCSHAPARVLDPITLNKACFCSGRRSVSAVSSAREERCASVPSRRAAPHCPMLASDRVDDQISNRC